MQRYVIPEEANLSDRKQTRGFLGMASGDWLQMDIGKFTGVTDMFQNGLVLMVTHFYEFTKKSLIWTLKMS